MRDFTAARANAERTLVYEGTVTRASTADPSFDPATITLTPGAPTVIYAGPVGYSALNAAQVAVAGRNELEADGVLRFPMAAVGIRPGDALTITAADDESGDPSLVGTVFVVGGPSTSRVLRRFMATRRFDAEGVGP